VNALEVENANHKQIAGRRKLSHDHGLVGSRTPAPRGPMRLQRVCGLAMAVVILSQGMALECSAQEASLTPEETATGFPDLPRDGFTVVLHTNLGVQRYRV